MIVMENIDKSKRTNIRTSGHRRTFMNTIEEAETLLNLAWDTNIDDDIRDSMLSRFEFMDSKDWENVKGIMITSSPAIKRIIDTIDTLREMS